MGFSHDWEAKAVPVRLLRCLQYGKQYRNLDARYLQSQRVRSWLSAGNHLRHNIIRMPQSTYFVPLLILSLSFFVVVACTRSMGNFYVLCDVQWMRYLVSRQDVCRRIGKQTPDPDIGRIIKVMFSTSNLVDSMCTASQILVCNQVINNNNKQPCSN